MVSAENPNFNGKAPHLMVSKGEVSDIVLMPGDPGRVIMFGEMCDDFKIVSSNREYTIGTGIYKGYPVTICSTGIGAPSTEIAVVELIELGAKVLIRVGGTGALKAEISCGDIIINTGAMRLGGSSNFYAPPEYPSIASLEVVNSLIKACDEADLRYWKGINVSVGSFFAGQGRSALGVSYHQSDLLDKYRKLNVLNMEMESETIMTLGSIFGVMTGSICAVHANRETDEWMYDFTDAQKRMCRIALESCVHLFQDYL